MTYWMVKLESFEHIEKVPEWAEVENFSKSMEMYEPGANDLTSDVSESTEFLNSNLEKAEIVTDLEMTEGIADYLETVEEIRYENWIKLSLKERAEVLNRVEQKIAEIEHRPSLIVNIEKMEPRNLGYQCADEHRIVLNSRIVVSDSLQSHRTVLDTIVHEGRHAYQHYNVDEKCIHESASVVKTWEKNFYDPKWGYYSYHGQKVYVPNSQGQIQDIGFLLYEQQPVEVDARNFTSDVLMRLEARGFIASDAKIAELCANEPSLEKITSLVEDKEFK